MSSPRIVTARTACAPPAPATSITYAPGGTRHANGAGWAWQRATPTTEIFAASTFVSTAMVLPATSVTDLVSSAPGAGVNAGISAGTF